MTAPVEMTAKFGLSLSTRAVLFDWGSMDDLFAMADQFASGDVDETMAWRKMEVDFELLQDAVKGCVRRVRDTKQGEDAGGRAPQTRTTATSTRHGGQPAWAAQRFDGSSRPWEVHAQRGCAATMRWSRARRRTLSAPSPAAPA